MNWTIFSDASIMNFLDTLKSDYFLISGLALSVLGWVVVKTKNTWDDKVYSWLKAKLGRQ